MASQPQPVPYVQGGDNLNEFLRSFWQRQIQEVESETPDFRHPALPLARIKKVMKSDPDVKVCGPVDTLGGHAEMETIVDDCCGWYGALTGIVQVGWTDGIFHKYSPNNILQSMRKAFINADSNKRRTLSRSDIATAIAKSDQFDFLIDIIPREDHTRRSGRQDQGRGGSSSQGGDVERAAEGEPGCDV
ncbi:hypothetical protein MPER_07520 [Moniliophthora perniciosa FA553]|nr:hypothetical protein MPER_07520 [Moniliophthora perniciosa FA553]